MNTKQKLTLGIAAIFMVTLTIVGVTYAYFTTQVTGNEDPTTVDVTSATFGSITYVNESGAVPLNAWANDDEVTINFYVKSESESAGKYDLSYTSNGTGFLKSGDTTPNEACIGLADGATGTTILDAKGEGAEDDVTVANTCYSGTLYDYVTVEIVRYASESDRTSKSNGTSVYSGRLNAAGQKFVPSIDIAAATRSGDTLTPAYHYYSMTVKHVDAPKNQNLEQAATVTVMPDISAIG